MRKREPPSSHPHRDSSLWRAAKSRQIVQVEDVQSSLGISQAIHFWSPLWRMADIGRLSVSMLKEDELMGVITIYRQEVRPFTNKQIELVQRTSPLRL